jgi:RNA polymerase sigma-70 factor, ECF subfamily
MAETSISLLDRLRLQPDEDSWKRLVNLYSPLIRGWLRRQGVQEQDADDLSQEVMTVVVRELPHFVHNQQPGAFRHWLRAVTVNRLRALWRAGRRGTRGSGGSNFAAMLDQLEDPQSALSRLWDQQHDQHVARRLLELIRPQFEEKTWRAFRRVVLDGLKPAAVAGELGMSVNAVLLAKSRVLSRLRQEMRGLTDR